MMMRTDSPAASSAVSTFTPVAPANALSRLARRALQRAGKKLRPLVVWLSAKLRLTVNPRPTRRLSRITLLMLLPFVPSLVQALPVAPQVTAGQAQISQPSPHSMTVQQSTQKAVIDWRNFNIARGESVVFNQPNAASVALNRVLSGNPSQIFGSLKANGSVFLVNSAGVYFAPGAAVNTGSFVASTLSLSNQDFLAGNYRFVNQGGAQGILNAGSINVQQGGYLSLIAPQINNSGVLNAPQGTLALAAGDRVTLAMGNGMVNVSVDAAALKAKLEHSGQAQAGQVVFAAKSAEALLDTVINTGGSVRATGMSMQNGKIVLDGGTRGVVSVAGQLDVSNAQGKGGTIQVQGDKIAVRSSAQLDASGRSGGGEVLVGGDWQGKGAMPKASMTNVAAGAQIKANAIEQGDGGKVVLWAEDKTRFDGKIEARGGAQGGNGGQVETSGKNLLSVKGQVDAAAAKNQGKGGTWLLDPRNVTISSGTNAGVDNATDAKIFDATADDAVVNVSSLSTALAGGNTIRVHTGSSGTQDGNITVDATVTASGNATLSLEAEKNIVFTANGKIDNNSNTLNVALKAGMSGVGGTAGTNASSITMDAASSIATGGGTLSATTKGAMTLSTINAGAGTVTLNNTDSASGALSQTTGAVITAGSLTVTNTGGATTLDQSNAIADLGAIDAAGKTVTLKNTVAVTQSGVLKADKLVLTNTGGASTLDQSNVIGELGAIDATGQTFTLKNTQALTQSGVLTADKLVLTNTGGATTLNQSNVIGDLGAIDATGQTFTLKNTQALTQSGVLTADKLVLTNTGGATTLDQSNVIGELGAIDATGQTFTLKNTQALTQSGVLTADKLVLTNTGGATTLDQSNVIGDLGAIDATGQTFTLKNTQALTQSGVLKADQLVLTNTSGASTLNQSNVIGDLGAIDATGQTFTLKNTQALTQSGVLKADKLVLTNTSGATTLDQSNVIGDLGAIDATGQTFTLKNTQALTQSGVLKADKLALTNTSGASTLNQSNVIGDLGAIDATGQTFTLKNTQALTQSGVLKADKLVLTNTSGASTLDQSNVIGDLGAIDASGQTFTLKNTQALTQSGVLKADKLVLTNTGGASTLDQSNVIGDLGAIDATGQTFTLKNTQALTQSGVLKASKLALTNTSGATTLNQSNVIGDLGAIDATGQTFTLKNTQALTQSGVLTADKLVLTNTSGASTLDQSNVIGDLGAIDATGQTFTLKNTQALTQSGVLTADKLVLTNTGGASTLDQSNVIGDLGAIDATGQTFTLKNTQALTQSGVMKADKLVLTNTGGATTLDQSNVIGDLGAIDATGQTFTLKNTQALTQSGVMKAGVLVLNNAGGAVTLGLDNEISELGDLTIAGGDFSLTNNASSFTFDGAISASGKNVSVVYKHSSGSFTFADGGSVKAASVDIQADRMQFEGGVTDGTNLTLLKLSPYTPTVDISLGSNVSGALSFDSIEASALAGFGSPVQIGNSSHSGNLNINSSLAFGSGTLTLQGGAVLSAASKTVTASALHLKANSGDIGSSTIPIQTNASTLSMNTSGKDVFVTSSNSAVSFAESNLGAGNLTFTGSGSVAQSGALTANRLTLTNTSGNVDLTGATNVISDLGTVNVSKNKNFSLKNNHALTQSGVLTADKLSLENSTGDVNLSTQNNYLDYLGVITNTGGNFSLKTSNSADIYVTGAINVGAHTATFTELSGEYSFRDGATAITAGTANFTTTNQPISQTSGNTLTTSGALNLSTGSAAVTLSNATNNFAGAVGVSNSGGVSLRDTDALILGAMSLGSGGLTVSSGGALSQTGVITTSGTASFTAGSSLDLSTSSNQLSGAVSLSNSGAHDLKFKNAEALSIASISAGSGSLAVEAAGAISQTGAITQSASAGAASFTSTGAITLSNSGNDFTGAVALTSGNSSDASIRDTNDLKLAASSVGKNLSITASGNLTQSGALSVGGTTSVTQRGAGSIILDNASNSMSGKVTIATAGSGKVGDFSFTNSHASATLPTLPLSVANLSLNLSNPNANLSMIRITNVEKNASLSTPVLWVTGNASLAAGNDLTIKSIALSSNATLNLSAGGDVKHDAATSIDMNGAATVTAGGAITLGNGNKFAGTLAINNASSNSAAIINNDGSLQLASSTLGTGNFTLTATGNITQSGPITQASGATGSVKISTGNGNITLDNANDFIGPVTLTQTQSNTYSATIKDVNDLVFGGETKLGGQLTITAGGSVSQAASSAIALNDTTGKTTINLSSSSADVDFSSSTTNNFGATLDISSSAGEMRDLSLKVNSLPALSFPAKVDDVNLVGTGPLVLTDLTIGGNLSVESSGALTQATGKALTVSGNASFNSGGNVIKLTENNAFKGTVALSGTDVSVTASGKLAFAASTASGTLTVKAGDDISQSGALSVSGSSSFSTAKDKSIVLDNSLNKLDGAITLAADTGGMLDASLTNTASKAAYPSIGAATNLTLNYPNAALSLPALELSGNLSVSAGNGVTQQDATVLKIAGDASFSASNGVITLDKANEFGAKVSLSNSANHNVSLNASTGIELGNINVGTGTLTISASGGDITQAPGETITQASAAGAVSVNAGAHAITLTNDNALTGTVKLQTSGSNDASIKNLGALTVSDSSVGQDLKITAGGALSLGANTAGRDLIASSDAALSQSGKLTASQNLQLTSGDALILGEASVGNNLNVTAKGNISQSDALTVGGTTTLKVDTATGVSVTLDKANDLAGVVTLTTANSGSAASLNLRNTNASATLGVLPAGLSDLTLQHDAAAINLKTLSLTGKLDVTAGGAITQSGTLTVGGAASFNAGANAITLNDSSNDFQAALSLKNSGSNAVSVTDKDALSLGASNVGGNLSLTAGGNISQSAGVKVGGDSNLTINGIAGGVTAGVDLSRSDNTFTGAVNLNTVNGATLQDVGIGNDSASASNPSQITGLRNLTLNFPNADVSLPSLNLSGDLNITAGGNVTQSGAFTVTKTTSINAGKEISLTQSNALTGAVTLKNSGSNNIALTTSGAMEIASLEMGQGALSLNAGGAITQSGAISQGASAGAVSVNAGANPITLDHKDNDFTGTVSLTTTGSNNATIKDANAITVKNGSVGQDLSITAGTTASTGGNTVGRDLSITAGDKITLGNDSVTRNLSLSGGKDMVLAGGTIKGNLEVSAKGDITQSGALTVTGTSSLTIADGKHDITLTQDNNLSGQVTLAVSGSGELNDVSLKNISKNDAAPLTPASMHSLSLNFPQAKLTLPGGVSLSGNLDAIAGGALTQSGNLSVTGTTTLATGANSVTLDKTNSFGQQVNVSSTGAVQINSSGALQLGRLELGNGALNVTADGAVTQAEEITQTAGGVATIDAAGNAITLTNNKNDFSSVSLKNSGAKDVKLSDVNDVTVSGSTVGQDLTVSAANITLGANTVGGALNLNAAGNVSQSGVLNVSGVSTIKTSGSNRDVSLNQANVFGGAVNVSADSGNVQDVTLRHSGASALSFSVPDKMRNLSLSNDAGPVSLPALDLSGNLTLKANGAISQSAAVSVAGNLDLTIDQATANIDLSKSANNIKGNVSLSTSNSGKLQDLSYANSYASAALPSPLSGLTNLSLNLPNAAVTLPAFSISGNLDLTVGGALSQSGAMSVGGSSTITAGANSVDLSQANSLTGALTLSNSGPNDVSINTAGKLEIASLNLGSGKLSLSSTGEIKQSGAITQSGAGAVSISAGANPITLEHADNEFLGSVKLSNSGGNAVALRDKNSLTLADSNVGQNLSITAATTVTTSGNKVGNDLSISAAKITLGNDSVTRDAALNSSGEVVLGAASVTRNLSVSAQGEISQTAALTVGGTSSFTIAGGTHDVSLSQDNNLAGAVTVATSGGGAVRDVNLKNISSKDAAPVMPANVDDLTLNFPNAKLALPGKVTIGGALTVSAGGDISQSDAFKVTGVTSIDAGAHTINLSNANNEFGAAVSLKNSGPNEAKLAAKSNLLMGASTIGGKLDLTAANISQSAPLTVAGATSLSINADKGSVDLSNPNNDFTGSIQISTVNGGTLQDVGIGNKSNAASNPSPISGLRNLTLNFPNTSVTLPTLELSGNLNIAAGGEVKQTGAFDIKGSVNIDAGASKITLAEQTNQFGGAVTLTNSGAQDVVLKSKAALLLGRLDLGSGALTIANLGAITQNEALTQSGAAAVSISAGANPITLEHADNNFLGALTLSNSGAHNISVVDKNALSAGGTAGQDLSLRAGSALSLAAITAGGALNVDAKGAITQSGAALVSGASTFTITGTKDDVTLDQANNFAGTVTVAAGSGGTVDDVTLRNLSTKAANPVLPSGINSLKLQFDNTSVTLPQTTIAGNLEVISGGAISQSGPLKVVGSASFNAGADTITLSDAGNDFQNAVTLSSSGVDKHIALSDKNSLSVSVNSDANVSLSAGSSLNLSAATVGGNLSLNAGSTMALDGATVGGNLNLTSGGNITQNGALKVSGALQATADSASGVDLTLEHSDNQFDSGMALASSNGGSFNDVKLNNKSINKQTLSLPSNSLHNLSVSQSAGLSLGAGSVSNTLTIDVKGDVEQSGALSVGGAASFKADANKITLGEANQFSGSVSLLNSGNKAVQLNNNSALILGRLELGSGALNVSANGAITQTDKVTQLAGASASFDAGANPITLNHGNNDFTGAVTLKNSGANNVTISDVNGLHVSGGVLGQHLSANAGGDLVFGANTIKGNLNANANGNITQSGALSVDGTSTFRVAGAERDVLLGEANQFKGTVSISAVNPPADSVRDVTVRSLGSTPTAVVAPSKLRNLSLQYDNAALEIATTNIDGNLSVTTGGKITQSGPISVSGTANFNAGANSIALNDVNNAFVGAVSLQNQGSNDVSLKNAGDLSVGASTVGDGALSISSVGGAITQTGAIKQTADLNGKAGAVSISTGNKPITLEHAENQFVGSLALSNTGANDVKVRNNRATELGALSLGQHLSLQSAGAITQSAALNLAGNLTLTASGTDVDVTLSDSANDFSGTLTLAASSGNMRNISVSNANNLATVPQLATAVKDLTLNFPNAAMTLPAMTLGGKLDLTAGKAVTQSGILTVSGATSVKTGAYPVTLDKDNDFKQAVAISNSGDNAVTLKDANTLELGKLDLGSGNLTINAGSNISQSGPLTQAASAAAAVVSSTSGSITMDHADNDFTGALKLSSSAAATVKDKNALDLGASTVSSLNLTSGGNISQSGVLDISGEAKFTIQNVKSDILLNTQPNQFKGQVTVAEAAPGLIDKVSLRYANNNALWPILPSDVKSLALQFDTASINIGKYTLEGDLSLTAGGNITQSDVLTVNGKSSFTAGGMIRLDKVANDFKGDVSLNTSGGGEVVIYDANNLTLGASTLGTGALTIQNNGELNQTGAVRQAANAGLVSINSGAGSINLIDSNNDFTGNVALTTSGSGNALITDANTVKFAQSSVARDLIVNAGGHITQAGRLTVGGSSTFRVNTNSLQNVLLADAENDFTGPVSIVNGSGSINNVEIRNVHPNSSASLTLPTQLHDLKLNYDRSAIAMSGSTLSGKLTAIAGGPITQTGALSVADVASFDAGANSITLDNKDNNFGAAVNLKNSGNFDVTLRDSNALLLDKVEVGSGKLAISAGGAITQSKEGLITQTGNEPQSASFNAGANAITLSNADNNLRGAVSLNNSGQNDVALRNNGPLNLGLSSLGSGKLTVQAAGAISQSGALTQAAKAGEASFDAGAAAIKLDKEGNDFTGAVAFNNSGRNDVSLVDANEVKLGKSNLGSGAFSVSAKSGITQDGELTQEAGADGASFNAGAGALLLTKNSNSLTGPVALNNSGANNVALSNGRALQLAASTVGSGTLTVSANGAITQSGALKQAAGALGASFNAGANAIALTQANNDFTGPLSLNNSGTNDVSVVDANALMLGASAVGNGNLNISTGGKLEQSGALTQAAASGSGNAQTTINTSGNLAQLNNNGNDFTLPLSLNSGDTQVVDKNGLILAKGAVTGALSLNSSAANITQNGALTVSGKTSIEAGAGTVSLTQSANDFTQVEINAANASITDLNKLELAGNLGALSSSSAALTYGQIKVAGNLQATASGAITQSKDSVMEVKGNASLNAGSNAITLTQANDFTQLEAKGGALQITDVNALSISATASGDASINSAALQLGASSINGALNVNANGEVTQDGALKVGGASRILAGGNAVTLADAENEFKGAVSVSNSGANNAISLGNKAALQLGAVQTEGNLTVSAQGVSQTADGLSVAGVSSISGGNSAIVLDAAKNDFVGALSLNTSGNAAASVVDANALQLGVVNVGGPLSVVSSGALTQSAALKLSGPASFNTNGAALTLAHAENTFGGKLTLNAGATQVNSAKNLDAELNTRGAVSLHAAADLSVAGIANGGALSLKGNKLLFGATTVEQGLSVQSGAGGVTQSAGLKVGGATDIKSIDNGVADLSHKDNDFIGNVSLDGAVKLVDASDLRAVVSGNGAVSLDAGGALDVSGSAASLAVSASGKMSLGNIKTSGEFSMLSRSGDITQQEGKLIDVKVLNITVPRDKDFGSATTQFRLNSAELARFQQGRNGFIQIPFALKTDFFADVANTTCLRVNLGACVNGNASISGAISSLQSGAMTGLSSKLQKEDASTKKMTYGFAGDLQAVASYPHQGALEVRPLPNCRSGNTIGVGDGGNGFAVQGGGDCGVARNGDTQQKITYGFTGDLQQATSLPHQGKLEVQTLPPCNLAQEGQNGDKGVSLQPGVNCQAAAQPAVEAGKPLPAAAKSAPQR
ncbi:filamentous hemagglutinin N-terminal domain-containing protein [Massilia sp. W12]|uniref:filamentous hemagglutinin N-terminal domain-containing protein n=1 Tax=Massilia sp. W12 TaxID=3126507 RepID=UPI0030D5AB56